VTRCPEEATLPGKRNAGAVLGNPGTLSAMGQPVALVGARTAEEVVCSLRSSGEKNQT